MNNELIYNRIENMRKTHRIPKMEFYARIGMSGTGYSDMVKNNSIKVSTLEKIADLFNIPTEFFLKNVYDIRSIPGNDIDTEKINKLLNEVEKLKEENIFLKTEALILLRENRLLRIDQNFKSFQKTKKDYPLNQVAEDNIDFTPKKIK